MAKLPNGNSARDLFIHPRRDRQLVAGAAALPTWLCGLAGLFIGLVTSCYEVPLGSQNDPRGGPTTGDDKDPGSGQLVTPPWRWENPLPQGNNLLALWGIAGRTADQDQLYAGGTNGTLVLRDSAGWQTFGWAINPRLPANAILAITGQIGANGPQVLGVGISDLAIRRTANRWADIRPQTGLPDGALNAVWATPSAGEYYVVGTTGRMFHVLQDGARWTPEGVGVTTDTLFGLAGTGSGSAVELYAVGDNGRIVHRTGGSWTVEAENLIGSALNAVWLGDGATSGEVFAVGNNGAALHKQGGVWTVETTGTTTPLLAAWGAGDDLYVAGAAGTILHRHGGTWQREAMGLTGERISALWGTVRDGKITLYAVGNIGSVLRLDSGMWQLVSTRLTDRSLNGVWARNPGEVYAVGNDGVILQRSGTAAQGSWKTVASGVTSATLNAVTGWAPTATSGEAEVWAVGTAGTIVHKSGNTWSLDGGFLTNQELTGVWAGPDSVYVVGRGGRMYHKTQGSWNIETGPLGMQVPNDLSAVWGTGSGTNEVVYVTGSQGLVLRHDKLGWTQEAQGLTSENLITLFGTSEDNLFATSDKAPALHRQSGQWQLAESLIGSVVAGCVLPSGGTEDLLVVSRLGFIERRDAMNHSRWKTDIMPTQLPYSGVAAAAFGDYYIVGSQGLILHKY